MKCLIELPDGPHCTGCPCNLIIAGVEGFMYGCGLLHRECEADGEFKTRAKKHKNCPTLRT